MKVHLDNRDEANVQFYFERKELSAECGRIVGSGSVSLNTEMDD